MPNYFVATFAFGWPTDPVVANILIALPHFETACVFMCLDHLARFIVNADHGIVCATSERPSKSLYGWQDR